MRIPQELRDAAVIIKATNQDIVTQNWEHFLVVYQNSWNYTSEDATPAGLFDSVLKLLAEIDWPPFAQVYQDWKQISKGRHEIGSIPAGVSMGAALCLDKPMGPHLHDFLLKMGIQIWELKGSKGAKPSRYLIAEAGTSLSWLLQSINPKNYGYHTDPQEWEESPLALS